MAGLHDEILSGFGGKFSNPVAIFHTLLNEYRAGTMDITEIRDVLGISAATAADTDLSALKTLIDAGADDDAKRITINDIQLIADRVRLGIYTDTKMRSRLGIS